MVSPELSATENGYSIRRPQGVGGHDRRSETDLFGRI